MGLAGEGCCWVGSHAAGAVPGGDDPAPPPFPDRGSLLPVCVVDTEIPPFGV